MKVRHLCVRHAFQQFLCVVHMQDRRSLEVPLQAGSSQLADCSCLLHSLASSPDSCSREFTPSSMRMWQKPTSCVQAPMFSCRARA